MVSPKVIGNLFAKTGNYGISATFYEKQYNDKNRAEDLTVLVDFLDVYKDAERTEKYTLILIDGNDFSDKLGDAEYYYGKYVVSAYFNGNLDDALLKSIKFIDDFGYTKHNPLRTLIYDTNAEFTVEEVIKIQVALIGVSSKINIETLALHLSDTAFVEQLKA